jgi:thiosulfate/3-mercaptopyruvate sulfurtransferase
MKHLRLIGFFLLGLAACQNKPTKITESPPPQAWAARMTETTKKPLKLSDNTVVLDSRSDFDYGLAHWSSSVHFTWEKLVQDAHKPWLMIDARSAQRKLALLGIQPKTPVVVIGYGHKGAGDEGRLAWMLLYYGINDVQTVSVDGLDVYFTHQETPARKNSEIWDTPARSDLIIGKDDFLQLATSPRQQGKHTVYIIDVRSKEEYFNRTDQNSETPDLHALQIDWHEFFGDDGRPVKSIRSKLHDIGVKNDDEVVLISGHGSRSAAAAYALIALGFKNVRTFLGGWDALAKQKK